MSTQVVICRYAQQSFFMLQEMKNVPKSNWGYVKMYEIETKSSDFYFQFALGAWVCRVKKGWKIFHLNYEK